MADISVSVIIAAYEQHEFLPLLLESLARQTYEGPVEVIVCDDGSDPRLMSMVTRAARPGLNLRYVWQPNRGPRVSRSRNNGLRLAENELVICLDGDVVAPPDLIARHVAAHTREPRLVMGSRRRLHFDPSEWSSLAGRPWDELYKQLTSLPHVADREFQSGLFHSDYPWSACLGCNVSVYPREAASFDEAFICWGLEDTELALRLGRQGTSLHFDADLEAIHLEWGDINNPNSALRPSTDAGIRLFVTGAVHFIEKYPDEDLYPIKASLAFYDYDAAKDEWSLIKPTFTLGPEARAYERARDWVAAQAAAPGRG